MKKISAIFLVVILAINFAVPVLAVNEVCTEADVYSASEMSSIFSSINENRMDELSFSQLKAASVYAEDDRMATLIFNELLERVMANGSPYAVAANYLIDNYVEVTDYSQSGNKLTLSYTIKAKVPSGASAYVGYQYPDETRANGGTTSISSKATGTYSVTYTGVSEIIAKQVYSSLTARDYKETHPYGTIYGSTAVVIDYHEVTAAEAISSVIVNKVVPGILISILPETKIIKYVALVIL